MSATAFCWLLTLTAVFASAVDALGAGAERSEDYKLRFLSADANFGGQWIREVGPIREGYTTLWWSPSTEAVSYRLTDSQGNTVYQGHLPRALVSGLPDGKHRFEVVGISVSGSVVATGVEPIVVEVRHWESSLAWSLFGARE